MHDEVQIEFLSHAWHPHPDPGVELLAASGDRSRLSDALSDPRVRADAYARLRLIDALYRAEPRDRRVEQAWLQEMLVSNRPEAAWSVARHWPVSATTGFERLFLAAQVAQAAAPRAETESLYRVALECEPKSVDAWQKALEAGFFLDQAGRVEDLFRQWDGQSDYVREKARFALSRLVRQSDPSRSFTLACEAQAMKRRRLGSWSAEALQRRLDRDRGANVQARACPLGTVVPVFVLGMPRSGTTLVSSMLASHPRVRTAGEQTLVQELGCGPAASAILRQSQGVETFRTWYLAAVGDLAGDACAIVDKMPFNAEHVGLILALFPDALVIPISRDVRDCAVSIHLHDFEFGCEFSRAGSDIREYADLIGRHLGHWSDIAPARVLPIRYEELVEEPRASLEPVLERLGLAWSEKMVEFWRAPGSVATFSEAQVRSPLNRRAVGAWRRYLPAARPFLDEIAG